MIRAGTKLVETEERTNFIMKNWKNMSDYEMANHLNLSFGSVVSYRCSLKLFREHGNAIKKEQKVHVAELFYNYTPIKKIMEITGLSAWAINRFLSRDMFFTRKSEETETIVLQSKINFDND